MMPRAGLALFALLLPLTATVVGAPQPGDLQAVCKSVWGVRADETNLRNLPASLPAPPAAARRCGARESFKSVYYVWNVPDTEILAYWEMALQRNGFRTTRVDGRTPGSASLDFAGPVRGKISLSRRGGGFVLVAGAS
jgi:hypothetical protein